MNTANWITLIVTLVTVAGTWGGVLVRIKVAERRIVELSRGREKQGERIGVVEERIATIEGAIGPAPPGPRRTRTRPVQIPIDDVPSAEVGE